MAIKISGTTVIDDNRNLTNVNIDDGIRKPVITLPANNATNVGASVGAVDITTNNYGSIYGTTMGGMDIQIDNNSDFSSPVIDATQTTTSTTYSFDHAANLATLTTYYVRVRHFDDEAHYSDWSDTITFTTAATFVSVTTPTITSPTSGATNIDLSATFTSSAFSSSPAGDTHVSSDWQIATDSSFSNIVESTTNDTSNLTSWTNAGSGTAINTTYYVRVRHTGSSYGTSDWSPAISYTTVSSVAGEQVYTTAGTYSWTAPGGVTSVSVLALGAAGGGQKNYSTTYDYGGGGGGLGWKNSISVTPGQSYTVKVGAADPGSSNYSGSYAPPSNGEDSYFINTSTVYGGGGKTHHLASQSPGGTYNGDGGGDGGQGGYGSSFCGGGGGAGGYTGAGGAGGNNSNGSPATGGGGGGGASGGNQASGGYGGCGGGVGLYGKGANGVGGSPVGPAGAHGGGGSGGQNGNGFAASNNVPGSGGGGGSPARPATKGGDGAVRIMWGGGRSFPTNAA